MLRKLKRTQQRKYATVLAALATFIGVHTVGYTAPSDGQIFAGSGAITQTGTVTTINQMSSKLGINWQDFNIAAGEKVQFVQPNGQSIALNRVVGTNGTAIYGQLTANGQVFLINPNGVLFASGAKVNVGGLVASTNGISDADFLAGNYSFSGDGTVLNQGQLTATEGGYIALIGGNVQNEGIIVANKGVVALASGQKVTLDLTGDGLINLAVDRNALHAVVANNQMIQANGGRVIMTAQTANDLNGTVVNSGIVTARTINNVNGTIILAGDTTVNSGSLDASGQTGGTVKVLGTNVALTDTSKINASGTLGGGTVLIGGNFQGKGTEQNAQNTTIAAGASITADATSKGNGGQVVVWSDNTTNYQGTITAKGGTLGGNGGQVEVSGKNKLNFTGKVDLRAVQGTTGILLLDPSDFTIAASGGDMTGAKLGELLGTASVTILSSNGGLDGTGNVTVQDAVTWSNSNGLTLSAVHDVNVNNTITNTSGTLVLRADNTGTGTGTVNFGSGTAVNVGNVSIYYNPDSTDITAYGYSGSNSSNNGSTNPYTSNVTEGNNLKVYMLVNNLGQLQAMNTNLNGVYALGRDVDASATNTGTGFIPIGAGGTDTDPILFTGVLNGDGHAIDQLTINNDTLTFAGLFGSTSSTATISNLGLTNVSIKDNGGNGVTPLTGSIAGQNNGIIDASYATGSVEGGNNTGGLVGNNFGSITNSYSAVSVSGGAAAAVGGIAGGNFKIISGSHNTGSVTGNSPTAVGGLAGHLDGTGSITQSYNTGAVSSTGDTVDGGHAGGLIGQGNGIILNSYNTGSVTITGNNTGGNRGAGGIAGAMWGGSITDSYSVGSITTTGIGLTSGGLLGLPWGAAVTNSYWDTDTSGKTDGGGYGGLSGTTGLSSANMKIAANFVGWTSPWVLQDGASPTFAGTPVTPGGGGTTPGGGGTTPPAGNVISAETTTTIKNIRAGVTSLAHDQVKNTANTQNLNEDSLITINLDNEKSENDSSSSK